MKTRKVEIEIPEDMEVYSSILVEENKTYLGESGVTQGPAVQVVLQKRKPRKWVFEEIVGATSVVDGGYYITDRGEVFISCGAFGLCHDQIALRLVEE